MPTPLARRIAFGLSLLTLAGCCLLWSQTLSIQSAPVLRCTLFAVMGLAMFGAALSFPNLQGRRAYLWLLLPAALLRLLLWPAPASDDAHRYLWESSLLWKGSNPYLAPASDPRFEPFHDHHWEQMNHRDRLTAYPPGMQLIMSATSWLWYDLRSLKLLSLLGDFWTLTILVLLLERLHRPPRWLVFYALNPLVLISFAAEAHHDSLLTATLLTTLWAWQRNHLKSAWLALACAIQLKLVALFLFPFLLIQSFRSSPSHRFPPLSLFLLALFFPCLPFLTSLPQLVHGLATFGGTTAFNSGLFETLRILGLSDGLSRSILSGAFLLTAGILGYQTLIGTRTDLLRTASLLLSALLLCSPIIHFWYFTWLLPLLVLRPNLPWLLLGLGQSVYFYSWHQELSAGWWGLPRGWVILAWLPGLLALLWEARHSFSRARARFTAGHDCLIPIIPLRHLDSPQQLPQLLERDGLSHALLILPPDNTDHPHPQVHHAPALGRGHQIAHGCEQALHQACPDLVAIVHADTSGTTHWMKNVLAAVAQAPDCPAFCLGQRFPNAGPHLLFIEMLNEFRATFGGSVFGDQTLILRRSALEKIGGFPSQPLMEDVEVSIRLKELGPILYLGQEWEVSAEKWKNRFQRRFFQVLSLLIRYHWVRRKSPAAAAQFSRNLFREYYRS